MKLLVVAGVVLAACGADQVPIDPDTCELRSYRIDAVELPANQVRARELGHDLDGDRIVDNQLGQVASTLHGLFGDIPLDLDASAAAHFATDTDWRITTWDCAGTARLGAITEGEAVAPTLDGDVGDGPLQLEGPAGAVPLTALFDGTGTTAPIFMPGEHSVLTIDAPGDDALEATLAVALEGTRQRELVIRAMVRYLNLHLDFGFEEVDADHDGLLSIAELEANTVVRSLLDPDVEVGGVEATSLGVRVHAVRVK